MQLVKVRSSDVSRTRQEIRNHCGILHFYRVRCLNQVGMTKLLEDVAVASPG
jgi:hypothetical protein